MQPLVASSKDNVIIGIKIAMSMENLAVQSDFQILLILQATKWKIAFRKMFPFERNRRTDY